MTRNRETPTTRTIPQPLPSDLSTSGRNRVEEEIRKSWASCCLHEQVPTMAASLWTCFHP